MNKGKKREAENLGEVLAALYAEQQSGLLRVECLQNGRVEKGELYILTGQPVYAHVGKLTGQEALHRLLLWHSLHFSFDTYAPRPPANLSSRAGASAVPVPPASLPVAAPHAAIITQNQEMPAQARLIPRKVGPAQQILSLPLTHRQRLIYFLIDGRRTIADLSRCSGKSFLEVKEILRELQLQGIIVVSS